MTFDSNPSNLHELLSPEPVDVESSGLSEPAQTSLRHVLRLFDADSSEESRTGPRIITFDRLSALTPAQRRTLRSETFERAMFVCPGSDAAAATIDTAPLAALTDLELSASAPEPVSRYAFSEQSELWPFAGLSLSEARHRTVPAFAPQRPIAPLVTAEHGGVFVRIELGKGIYVSTVPLAQSPENGMLKNELEPTRFMALLPLVLFLRSALGEQAWRTPHIGATFMVDDPNLRFSRYGFLDLKQLVSESERHGFHTSIAMIPLDYRKSRPAVTDLIVRHADRVSLVMHGVDHLRHEFEADVSLAVAEETLAQGLARMEAHEQRTGIRHARAITFPYGLCNATWMEAVRNVGFDAAVVSRSLPFLIEAEIDDPLYELYPAQMTSHGLPVVNRFKAELPEERLLFQALLGKPLIVYTHHTFFRDGMERLLGLAKFVNRQVGPRWRSVDDILRANYQLKRRQGRTFVRTFSNRVTVSPAGSSAVILKLGRDIPADEVCTVGSSTVEPIRIADGLAVSVVSPTDPLQVVFHPAAPRRSAVRRVRLRSRARRLGTELRDQLVMPGMAAVAEARQRSGRRRR